MTDELKDRYSNYADIPENARNLYGPDPEKGANGETGFVLKSLIGLKKNQDELRRDLDKYRARAAEFETWRSKFPKEISPDDVESIFKEREELARQREEGERLKAEEKGAWLQLQAKLEREHEAALKKMQKEMADLREAGERDKAGAVVEWQSKFEAVNQAAERYKQNFVRHLTDNAILLVKDDQEINGSPGFTRLMREYVREVENPETGDFSLQVFRDGKPVLGEKNKPMTLKDFAHELKRDPNNAWAFNATGAHGSGASPSSAGNGGAYTISATDARDHAKFMRAYEEAQKNRSSLSVTD